MSLTRHVIHLALLTPLFLFAQHAAQSAPPSDAHAVLPLQSQKVPQEQDDKVAAYPIDKPKNWGQGGRKAGEIDVFLGPSVTNSLGMGLGFRSSLFTRQTNQSSLGFKYGAGLGGGLYQGTSRYPGIQPELIGGARFGLGYYSVEGLKNGSGFHVLLDIITLGATYLGNVETLLSYVPGIEVGYHGRSAETLTFWWVQVEAGLNMSYLRGALQKLTPQHTLASTMVAPTFVLRSFLDTPFFWQKHIRLSASASDIIDSLGASFGTRHVIQANFAALVKTGSWFYTGPQIFYFFPTQLAQSSLSGYQPGTPQWTFSWLVGGALGSF